MATPFINVPQAKTFPVKKPLTNTSSMYSPTNEAPQMPLVLTPTQQQPVAPADPVANYNQSAHIAKPTSPVVAPKPAPTPAPVDNSNIPTPGQSDFTKALQSLSGNTTSSDPQSQLASLYAKAYTPSSEETAAQGQFNQANTQLQKTQSALDDLEKNLKMNSQGITQTVDPATGQMRTVSGPGSGSAATNSQLALSLGAESRSYAPILKAQTAAAQEAQNALSTATSNRTALQGALPGLTSLSEYQSPQQQLAAQLAEEKAMKEGGYGTYAKTADQGYTLSAGQTRYDEQGNVLSQSPASPSTIKSAQGGLYDTSTGQWVVPPQSMGGADPDVLAGMMALYQTTGTIPASGYGAAGQATRNAFYSAIGQQVSGGSNIVGQAAENKATLAGATATLETQTNQLAANKTALSTLDKQLSIVENLSNKVDRSGSPVLNKYVLWTKGQYAGDEDTVAFNNAIQTASYEFSKILSGAAASIAGVTISSAEDAKSVLNANMTPSQIKKVVALMQQESQNRITSQQDTVSQIKNDIKTLGTGNSQQPSQPSQTNQGSSGGSGLASRVAAKGLDYAKMVQSGLKVAEIRELIGE